MHASPKQQLTIILLVVLFGFIGNSIAYPILPPLFLHPAHGDIVPYLWNSSWRSVWLGVTLMMYPIGQFIGAPILGAWSDQYGRKNILIFSTVLVTLFYLLTALSLSFDILWLLIASRFLTGCFEGNMSIARAMVVDIKNIGRDKSLGLINAMTSIGYIIGPVIGGVLADNKICPWFNFSVPFYITALFTLCVLILAIFYLYETNTRVAKANSKISILKQLNIVSRLKRLCQNKTLKVLIITSVVASLSYDTFYEFLPTYLTGLWHSTSADIAWYNAVLSVAIAISCGWFANYLSRFLNKQQNIILGLLGIVIVLISLLFVPSQDIVMLLMVVIGFAIGIATNSYILQVSEAASENIQGEVFGTLWGLRMLLDGIICITGGLMIMLSYTLPFAIAAVAALVSLIIYVTYHGKGSP